MQKLTTGLLLVNKPVINL